MSLASPGVTAAFVLYLLLMLAIGALAYRQTRTLSDYILGGRRLNRWVAALSAEASDMSAWLLLGLPGYAYLAGFEAGWLALGLLVGTYLNWRLVADRLRRYTEAAGDALTLPDFLAQRFADASGALRIVAGLFILIFFTLYTASGLVAGGKLFATVFGLPYAWAVAAGALVVVLYTLLGGFLAVAWTDVVQGLLMVLALLVVPVVAIGQQGGWLATQAGLAQLNPALLDPFTDADGHPLGVLAMVSLLAWGLGYFGQPHILARFMAIRDPAELVPARRIAVTWVSLSLAGASLVGIAGVSLLSPPLQGNAAETVFMGLVGTLFHPLVAGVLLAAILAAIMSTADSQLLVASSALANDFYRGLWRREAGRVELVWVGRAAVLAIAVLAYLLALDPDSSVLDLVAYAWAGFGAVFGPTLLLALFWRGMHRNGALASMLTGGLVVLVWRQLGGGWAELYEMVPGFGLALLAGVVASLLSPPPAAAVLARFERVAGRRA